MGMEESKRYKIQGTKYKIQCTSNKWQVIGFRLMAGSLYLVFCSLSSFAQQSNKVMQQGNEAYKKGDYNAAIKDYSKALETDTKNTTAWFNMGNALQKTMNAEEAAKSYDEVINNATDADLRSKAYYNKALAMLQQKNLQAAINTLKQSLRLTPEDNDARENLQIPGG